MRTLSAAGLLLCLIGCSSSTVGADGSVADASTANGCTMILSGALTVTVACTVQAQYANGFGALTIVPTDRTFGNTSVALLHNAGPPAVGSWTDADPNGGWITVHRQPLDAGLDPATWTSRATGLGPPGTYTATFTSVALGAMTTDAQLYVVHGTVAAMLVPADGTTATGSVNMSVTF